jgi:EmrB/QacA subfamily drug resistance transporter
MLQRGRGPAPSGTAADPEPPTGGRWPLVAVAIGVSAFLTTIDNTIVNVALPSIQRDLHMSLPALQWVVVSYLLTFSALLLTGGRLADRYGRRRILLTGLAVFTAASIPAGTATNAAMLLTARALQGAGAALVLPAGLAIVAVGRTPRERDAGAAVWMAALAAALATGPLAGGWLTQHLGWNWIFLVNVPVGLAGLLLGWLAIDESGRLRDERVDAAGLLSGTVMLGAAAFALIEGPGLGWGSPAVAGAAVLAGAAGICFGWAEHRAPDPMVDVALVAERALRGGIAASILWGAGVNGVFFFTSLFLQRAAGFSATRTGLVFVPIAVLVVLVTPLTPGLVERFGAARTSAAGLILVAAGLAAVALTRDQVTMLRLLPGVAAIGIGSALSVPLTSSVLAAVPPARTGVASSLLGVAREASGLVGISVIGLIVSAGHPVPTRGRLGGAFVSGYGTGLLAAAGLVLVAALIAGRTLPGRGGSDAVPQVTRRAAGTPARRPGAHRRPGRRARRGLPTG